MTGFFLAILIAQASPNPIASASPLPAPTLSPAWVKRPLDGKYDYARFARREQDGTESEISAARQVCDCQPPVALSMVQLALSSVPGVAITRGPITICGQAAQRLIATGLAAPGKPSKNIEAILFRREPALYTFTYTFLSAAPAADAESALSALCP